MKTTITITPEQVEEAIIRYVSMLTGQGRIVGTVKIQIEPGIKADRPFESDVPPKFVGATIEVRK